MKKNHPTKRHAGQPHVMRDWLRLEIDPDDLLRLWRHYKGSARFSVTAARRLALDKAIEHGQVLTEALLVVLRTQNGGIVD